jgi:hypothetical protein
MRTATRLILAAALLAGSAVVAQAGQIEIVGPWTGRPLTFGMTHDQAEEALGVPLTYVRGSRGSELYLALPNQKGSLLANRSDGLYLQFHRGRLQGWKGDWGTIRPRPGDLF